MNWPRAWTPFSPEDKRGALLVRCVPRIGLLFHFSIINALIATLNCQASLLNARSLEPEVSNTSTVSRQIFPLLQSVEVIDREVGYGFGLSQAQIDGNSAATFCVRLQCAPVGDAAALRAEVKTK